ncbi:MAG TPA: alpha/beta family hydrolase [Gemmatimonadaceae bacterium]|nr:alpha/beta family hydrolase [Gemmatimonadaceae bacterium]
MTPVEWKVPVAQSQTTAIYEEAAEGNPVFICAHGAGGNIADRATLATARALCAAGIGVVRFNFLYREKKAGRPDPMPKLMETFTAVAGRVRAELNPGRLVIGGRSMGGRAASMLAADGYDADGLLLLAYPLHPPGKPEQLRDAHLPRIGMPVLCFNGTRDPFCTRELMERAIESVTAPWEMHWMDGADHSFHVLKSFGRTDAGVLAGIADVTRDWIARMSA